MTQPAEKHPSITPDPGATEPAGNGTSVEPAADPFVPRTEQRIQVAHTRTSAAWVGVWAGVVVLILLIIFVAQNTASVKISFFNLEGQISLALALLIAGVGGAIVSMAVAATRILQLRRMVRRGR